MMRKKRVSRRKERTTVIAPMETSPKHYMHMHKTIVYDCIATPVHSGHVFISAVSTGHFYKLYCRYCRLPQTHTNS